VVALLAYIPLLVVRPGVVTPDTKTYLYLDPGRFLAQVAFMWNPTVGLGTVTHEYIGYLLPMGPFFGILAFFHVPIWVAQRLWLGTILFAAGLGILYLSRVLRLRGPGPIVAALAYMLSPYFLQYAGRISVILLPWAGLPFLLAFTILAVRRGGWRMPALFAIVIALVSGINATAIIYVGVVPILWIIYAVVVLREATWRQAIRAALRIGLLSLFACLWWIAGLMVEAGYGVNVLKYTETVPSTSATSNASEVLRGLGYWYFYGSDHLGPWTRAAVRFTQDIWLLATSYAVPVLALVAATLLRWRERSFFILLVVVGMVLSVGPFPYTHPTAVGGVLKTFMTDTTAGLALRSTDRALPVVLLGLAMLLGSGVTALYRRFTVVGVVTAVLIGALVVANNPSLFNGDTIANNFTQPAKLPSYQMQAIDHLNKTHPGTRVLAIPGNDFASDSWGDTVDTPQSAYLTRNFITREQQIMGSIPTADTLYAMDDPIQEDVANYNALAPMARLLSAGDVMVEYDQDYAHYGIPQSQLLALQLAHTPQGLTDPTNFGPPRPNESTVSTLNEQDLAAPSNASWPSPLVTYSVPDPRPILRAESDTGSLIVSGDATGLNDLAGLGMLNTSSAIYYSGSLTKDRSRLRSLANKEAQLVVTDTNRKQAFRWDTLSANAGATETPSEDPAKTDASDSPVELFPGAPISTKTTASYVGAVNVTASSYGNSVSFTPEDRGYSAIDNNLDTAWITGTFVSDPAGQWWQVQFAKDHAVTTNHVTIVQPQKGDRARWISKVTATFDGKHPIMYRLNASSHLASGQTLTFPTTTFHTLRLTIDSTTDNTAPPLTASAVGFSEVEIPGQSVQEVIAMPTDLLSGVGQASLKDRLTLVMTRERTSPFPPRTDPETTITRSFTLPTARTFTLSGTASMSALIPDSQIDQLVGRSGITAYSSGRLPGDLQATTSATLDDNPATVWQPGLGEPAQVGATLTYDLKAPTTLTHLSLGVVADGRHSVPTSLTISANGQSRRVTLPAIADSSVPGAVTTVPLSFPALRGQQFVITFTGVRQEMAANYYSAGPLTLPLGIATVSGLTGAPVPVTPTALPGNCTAGLLTLDGHPIDVAVVGSTATALDDDEVQVVPCGPDAKGIALSAGTHILQTAVGHTQSTGWNIDQLVLDSAPGGAAAATPTVTPSGEPSVAATQAGAAPAVAVQSVHIDTETAKVTGATSPFELVLGQSINSGWRAVASPGRGAPAGSHSVSLGTPQLIDSFANGWAVTQADLQALGSGSFVVTLDWAPQREVWAALALSGATLLLCVVLGFLPRRVRVRTRSGLRRLRRWRPWRRERRSGRESRRERRLSELARGSTGPTVAAAVEGPAVIAAASANGLETASTGAVSVSVAAPVMVAGAGAGAGVVVSQPQLVFLHREPRHRVRWWNAILLGLVTGVVAAGVTSLSVGGAVALLVIAGLLIPWVRWAAAFGGVGFIVAGCLNVIRGQAVHHYLPGSNWAGSFVTAGNRIWIGVVLLLADAVIVSAGARSPRPAPPASDEPSPPT
jgi:arabinofuranan 3-O-arabinosyltransferase